MPSLKSISTVNFPNKVKQQEVKRYAHELFVKNFPAVERMMSVFDNTEIITRNFCRPLDYYASLSNFKQQNAEYISTALEFSVQAIEKCMEESGTSKERITDLVFISTSGLATPSLDALIINKMRLNPHINRIPVFGLGCAGGVSGFAKAQALANANPDAVVLLVVVELCSLTFLRNDFSKSNFVATSLFSDGVAASLVLGDNHAAAKGKTVHFMASQSKLYYDTLDVMGWEFQNEGFKVLFSHDIPTIIGKHIRDDVNAFLHKNNLHLDQISNFIFHPGGKKVLNAYAQALPVAGDFLKNTREVMNENGNMSSVTVLYVLEKFWKQGFKDGYGLMVAMGPGFSSEMVLLDMQNR
jgi:alkylresorcinol/alkylpyrone synthase